MRLLRGLAVLGVCLTRETAGQVIDSLLPMPEEIRRFRADLGAAPSGFEGGSSSRDALVQRFATALARRDSTDLRKMLISKREFAYLYFPESEYVAPPYRQKPSLVWFRLAMTSERGIGRALARDGGGAMQVAGYRCAEAPRRKGGNRIWSNCRIQIQSGGTRQHRRLFGPIVERAGRFKFLTYATDY